MSLQIARYWQTARHLRPVQIHGRLRSRIAVTRPDHAPVPSLRAVQGVWVPPAARPASMTGPRAFDLLNRPGDLDAIGWDNPAHSLLWRFNLHYFDDLNAENAADRLAWHTELVTRWIRENPPGKGTGWRAYPLSLRIVNWIKWMRAGQPPPAGALQSLAVQTRWLARNIEWHLLGNHLFSNAKALVFAGCFFAGDEAEKWLNTGLAILRGQLPEQVLPDGGQFELSPMYHALAFEDILDIVNILRSAGLGPQAEIFESRIVPMARWLAAMTHPDGGIAFFNDATHGVAPSPAALFAYASRLGFAPPPARGTVYLRDSGYGRLVAEDAVLIADMAAIGPDHLPGHAHADTLSFELSLFGQRVIVNSGVSEYGSGVARQHQRGTAAHSTLEVCGRNSSDVWAGFRVARRARVHQAALSDADGGPWAGAEHDGYARLAGQPRHRREWHLTGHGLTVSDHLTANQPARAYYHLHPSVTPERTGPRSARLRLKTGQECTLVAEGALMELGDGLYNPAFGLSVPNRHIVLLPEGRACRLTLSWKSTPCTSSF